MTPPGRGPSYRAPFDHRKPQSTIVRRLLLAIIPAVLAAPDSGAQIIRRGSLGAPPPAAWVSAGIAQTGGWRVSDGTTGSEWDFGSATQYHVSLEKANGGVSFGLRGTRALVPLRYTQYATGIDMNAITTDADANVSQVLANVHVASGRGFHSVLELDAGATIYSDFRARGSGDKLAPASDTDFSFAFGYGFGYGFSNRFGVEVVQERGVHLHQRTGLSANQDTNVPVNSTRIVGRLGLGTRQ